LDEGLDCIKYEGIERKFPPEITIAEKRKQEELIRQTMNN